MNSIHFIFQFIYSVLAMLWANVTEYTGGVGQRSCQTISDQCNFGKLQALTFIECDGSSTVFNTLFCKGYKIIKGSAWCLPFKFSNIRFQDQVVKNTICDVSTSPVNLAGTTLFSNLLIDCRNNIIYFEGCDVTALFQ